MSKTRSFIYAWALTTAILTANVFLSANEGQEDTQQEPVSSSGSVVIDRCNVGATLKLEGEEIKAVVVVENPTDEAIAIDFNYRVQCMPNASPFSRMMPLPKTRASGNVHMVLAAGQSAERTIAIAPENEREILAKSGSWTVVVNRDEWEEMPMFGAGAPVVAMNSTPLTGGPAVLASLQLTEPLSIDGLIVAP